MRLHPCIHVPLPPCPHPPVCCEAERVEAAAEEVRRAEAARVEAAAAAERRAEADRKEVKEMALAASYRSLVSATTCELLPLSQDGVPLRG